jgi:peroxiredoxin
MTSVCVYQRWQVTHPKPRAVIKVGDQLPPVTLETDQGKAVRVNWSFPAGPTVLYVFRPDCVWCAKNLEAFRTVLRRDSGYRFVGLSLRSAGLADYLHSNQPFFEHVWVVSDQKTRKLLKMGVTPQTIIVSATGTVLKVWPGAYVGKVRAEVENTFGVKLPVINADRGSSESALGAAASRL